MAVLCEGKVGFNVYRRQDDGADYGLKLRWDALESEGGEGTSSRGWKSKQRCREDRSCRAKWW